MYVKKLITAIFFLLILAGSILLFVSSQKSQVTQQTREQISVSILNVGQGDAILIEGAEKIILVDTGPPSAQAILLEELRRRKIRKIDILLLTHAHADHIGNAAEVIEKFDVGEVIEANFISTSPYVKKYYLAMKKKNIPLRYNKKGEIIEIGNGGRLIFLTPIPEFDVSKNINNQSIVAKLVYGRNSILLTGDMENDLENRLVKHYSGTDLLNSQILKSPHHGSKTSSSAKLISAIKSDVAVISLKTGNDFGHPHELVLKRYQKNDMKTYQTNLNGTIRVLLSRENYQIVTEF